MSKSVKHTVHVTVTMSVEIDETELRKEFGKVNKKMILEAAESSVTLSNMFDSESVIFETYSDEKQPHKGRGSY